MLYELHSCECLAKHVLLLQASLAMRCLHTLMGESWLASFHCWLLWFILLQLISFTFRLNVEVLNYLLTLLPVRLWFRCTSACRSLPYVFRLCKLFEFGWWYLPYNCHTFCFGRRKMLVFGDDMWDWIYGLFICFLSCYSFLQILFHLSFMLFNIVS